MRSLVLFYGSSLDKVSEEDSIFTNVYGFARSLIALSLLIALLFTEPYVYFPAEFLRIGQPEQTIVPNLFYIFGEGNLNLSIYIACFILVAVISGFLPQVTGILHAWVAYSFFTGALIIEGGDQIGQIISILLVPVTLFDRRINHWHTKALFNYNRPEWIDFFCYTCLIVIQVQMAIVYFFAVAEKIHSPEWVDGSAFYYWFNHNPFGAGEPLQSLLNPIISYPYVTPLITWGVLVLEATLFGALFMKREHKQFMFKLGLSFHFMIIVIHGLWSFFFAMAGGLIIYLLPWHKPLRLQFLRQWRPSFYLLFLSAAFVSCEEEEFHQKTKSQLDSVYTIASDFYFWNNRLPPLDQFDFGTHSSPESILSALRAYSIDSVDRWSFAVKKETWEKVLRGLSEDFGLGLRFLGPEDLRIAYTLPNSPAGLAGLHRGLKVVSVNGISADNNNVAKLNVEFQTSRELILDIQQGDSITSSLLRRAEYGTTPVLLYDTFNVSNHTVAYLNIFTFSKDDYGVFDEAFSLFEAEQAEYLIVDLRYNGGGLLPVMEDLANRMVCSNAYGQIMYQSIYNEVYKPFNSKTYFHQANHSVCFKKVYFITAYKTASASEVLINALKPYLDVQLIGTPTHGKLMGMHTVPFSNYVLIPVAFKIVNRDESHDNFQGFAPDIFMTDGVDNDWGVDEACVEAAIDDITGQSSSSRQSTDEKDWSTQGHLIEDSHDWNGAYLDN